MQKIDPLKLFYMQSKGLSLFRAKGMIVKSEMETLVAPLREKNTELTDEMRKARCEKVESMMSV
jgi:Fe-S cluster assembly scaffold protein SufB